MLLAVEQEHVDNLLMRICGIDMITIGITFCDNDYSHYDRMIQQIGERIRIPHEVIVIDNTQGAKLGGRATFAFGYNAYQFAARYKIIKLAKGDYIWFVDGDDEVFELNELRFKDDILIFNFLSESEQVNLEDQYISRDFRSYKFIQQTARAALWNKLIRRSLYDDIDQYVDNPLLKVVSLEDTFYVALALKNARSLHVCKEYIYRHNRGLSTAFAITANQFKTLTTGFRDVLKLFVGLGYDEQEILTAHLMYFSLYVNRCDDPAKALEYLIRAYPIKEYWVHNYEQIVNSTYSVDDFNNINNVFREVFGITAIPKAWYGYEYEDGHVDRIYYEIQPPTYTHWKHSLSIVLLVYDGNARYLDTFITLIKSRIHVDYEIIIVDNRDNKNKDINATVILPKNIGILDGRRAGFEAAKNDYIWFVDIDDEVLPVHNRDYGDYDVIALPFYDTNNYRQCGVDKLIEPNQFFTTDTIRDIGVVLWNKWYKRSILEEVYKQIPSFFDIYYEDCLVYYTALRYAKSIRCFYVEQPVYIHTIHTDSTTTGYFRSREAIDKMFIGYEEATEYMHKNFADHEEVTYGHAYNSIYYLRMITNTAPELKAYLIHKVIQLMGVPFVIKGLNTALKDDYNQNYNWVAEVNKVLKEDSE